MARRSRSLFASFSSEKEALASLEPDDFRSNREAIRSKV
jgi:hypothetical protein